jgi:hypothetical protein
MTDIKIQKRRYEMTFKALSKGPSKGFRFKRRRWATKWEIAGGIRIGLYEDQWIWWRWVRLILRIYENEFYPLLRTRKVREQFRTSIKEISEAEEKFADAFKKFDTAMGDIVIAETKHQVAKYRELGRKQRAKQKK